MSKVERKEFHESKLSRTVSPTRYGSHQNVTEFDNNLDHLLEDLQSTVSRPGSAMQNGHHTRTIVTSNGHSGDEKMPQFITVNPVNEYRINDSYSYTAPDGSTHLKSAKKEYYSYKSGGEMPAEKLRMQNNINQLDSLLDDLQQVRQAGIQNNNTLPLEAGYQQQQYSSSNKSSSKMVTTSNKILPATTTTSYNQRTRSLDRTDGSVQRQVYHHNEGSYGDIKSIRTTTPSPTRSNTSTLNRQVRNVQQYPTEVVETTTHDINPEILAQLDPDLLPSGNTKVTTTIKTYTYEIPGNGDSTERLIFTPNTTSSTIQSTPSKSFIYEKNQSASQQQSTHHTTKQQHHYVPGSPGSDRKVVKETVTTRNYHPNSKVYTDPAGKHTYVYNETTTTRNYRDVPGGSTPTPPPTHHVYHDSSANTTTGTTRHVYHDEGQPGTTTTTYTYRDDSPDRTSLPPVTTTIHKFDSMTNLNARQYPDVETFDPKYRPPTPQTPPQQPDVNITYKYRSTTNTTNRYNTEQYDNEPLLPRKFPTDADGPPKKLDDLMASIGNEPPTNAYNAGWKHHEEEMQQQRKVDNLKAQQDYEQQRKLDQQQQKNQPLTKNVTGPPVYYPPGHEMFAKKEESGAWRAEGAMAKEKGMYKYEAESKSKSKSSSGAAIVPVCLPLCCGLPCTII